MTRRGLPEILFYRHSRKRAMESSGVDKKSQNDLGVIVVDHRSLSILAVVHFVDVDLQGHADEEGSPDFDIIKESKRKRKKIKSEDLLGHLRCHEVGGAIFKFISIPIDTQGLL